MVNVKGESSPSGRMGQYPRSIPTVMLAVNSLKLDNFITRLPKSYTKGGSLVSLESEVRKARRKAKREARKARRKVERKAKKAARKAERNTKRELRKLKRKLR